MWFKNYTVGSCINYAVATSTNDIKIGFPIGSLRHGQAGLFGIELTNHSYQFDRSDFSVVELIKRHVITLA